MADNEYIFENGKRLHSLVEMFKAAKTDEERSEVLKSLIGTVTYYAKTEADVVSLFIDEGPDIKTGLMNGPDDKKVIPLFLTKNNLGVFQMPNRPLVTKMIRVVRDAYNREDCDGIVIDPFGSSNMILPKKFLKIVLDVYDGKL